MFLFIIEVTSYSHYYFRIRIFINHSMNKAKLIGIDLFLISLK